MSGRCSESSWREPLDESGVFWPVAFIQAHGLRARLLLYEFDSVMTFGPAPESVSREADGLLHQISTIRPTEVCDSCWTFLMVWKIIKTASGCTNNVSEPWLRGYPRETGT